MLQTLLVGGGVVATLQTLLVGGGGGSNITK